VTGTEFVDTSGAVVGAGSGTGDGTYYYGVTSEDDDGDESAQSLGISPASLASSASSVVGCFIDTVSRSMPKQWIWLLVLISIGIAIGVRCRVSGVRRKGLG